MAKKRRIRYDHIFLLVACVIFLVIACLLLFKLLFGQDDSNNNSNSNNNIKDEIKNNINISLISYDVYKASNILDFNFVVATFKFENKDGIRYDLSDLITDENIKLSDVYMYQKKIKLEGYNYDLLDTIAEINTDNDEYICKIFIPFISDKDTLLLTDQLSNETFTFDLNTNEKQLDTLKETNDETTVSSANYDLVVSNSYISDMMTRDGVSYDSSMLDIYTFKIEVVSVANDIKVENAVYNKDSTGESFDALDASYSSIKIDNIIDKNLKAGDSYALFFEVFTDSDEKQDFKGTITFIFSDGTSKTINTVLK